MIDIEQHIIECTRNHQAFFNSELLKFGINPDKAVLVHPNVLPDHEGYLTKMIEYIIDQLNSRGWDSTVVFHLWSEGFAIRNIKFYDDIAKHLIINFLFPLPNFIYMTGAAKINNNVRLYHKYCAEFNILPLKLIHVSSFENMSLQEDVQQIECQTTIKKDIQKNSCVLTKLLDLIAWQ